MTVVISVTDVAGVIEAFLIEDTRGFFGVVIITLHYIFASDEYLAVLFADLHLDVGERLTDGANFVVLGTVRRDDTRLGHAVTLKDSDAGRPKCIGQFL